MSKYVIDSTTLVAIGDAVREKEGTTEPIVVSDLADRISAIETGGGGDLPEEAFTITEDCTYRFANNGWNWFIEKYGNKITTNNITNMSYMFNYSTKLEEIPFDVNMHPDWNTSINYAFSQCQELKNIPRLTGKIKEAANLFEACRCLRELKEESVAELDWSGLESQTSAYQGNRSNTFKGCYSLRKFPMSFLAHGNPYSTYSYSLYYNLFYFCCALDEVIDLPIPHRNATWTSNAFNYMVGSCYRLKRLTFETNEDGSPIKINGWSKQSIILSDCVGYAQFEKYLTDSEYNSGITTDTKVTDDASYQALKDNPDWWTLNINYSRYNHDSAVETINTLPDLSGGAGSNTIQFKGASGALTDGGAINTLTEEEIAVATAKGWTVTLV